MEKCCKLFNPVYFTWKGLLSGWNVQDNIRLKHWTYAELTMESGDMYNRRRICSVYTVEQFHLMDVLVWCLEVLP